MTAYAFFSAECRSDGVLKPLCDDLPPLYEITIYPIEPLSDSHDFMSEIINAHSEIGLSDGCWSIAVNGVSKAVGIINVASLLGFSMSDVIALGDGHNDIAMIIAAGVGVAMGNASDEIKAVADIITDSVQDDGLYKVFEKLGVI